MQPQANSDTNLNETTGSDSKRPQQDQSEPSPISDGSMLYRVVALIVMLVLAIGSLLFWYFRR
jgi:hypothetical protein